MKWPSGYEARKSLFRVKQSFQLRCKRGKTGDLLMTSRISMVRQKGEHVAVVVV